MTRLKLYALGLVAFVLGLLGIYLSGRRDGVEDLKADLNEKRIEDFKSAKEIEDEVRSLDDPTFIDRAGQWVRKDSDK